MNIMKKVILFSLFLIANHFCAQNDGDPLQDENDYPKNDAIFTQDNEMKIAEDAYDITECLPSNYVVNASVDYTSYVQKCLDAHLVVKMPDFPLLINESGLAISSGARIFFQNESALVMKGNSLGYYGIIKIYNVEDVIIYSPVVVGDRDKHIGTTGEWGMGINILGSKNIHIMYPNISNCWGDGIYVGEGNNGTSDGIEILYGKIDNCRRNGISLVDGKNIKIQNTVISNTNGTSPQCGIDIEPNDDTGTVDNIEILNVTTLNNVKGGIQIYLSAFTGKVQKQIRMKISNHIDDGSNYGFMIYGINPAVHPDALPFLGSVTIENPYWKSNGVEPIFTWHVNDIIPPTTFSNIKIVSSSTTLQNVLLRLLSNKLIKVN